MTELEREVETPTRVEDLKILLSIMDRTTKQKIKVGK